MKSVPPLPFEIVGYFDYPQEDKFLHRGGKQHKATFICSIIKNHFVGWLSHFKRAKNSLARLAP